MNNEHHKYPRLFVVDDLNDGQIVTLDKNQSHYLTNVMRKKVGDFIRLFNSRDGEFLCAIDTISKKFATLRIDKKLRIYPPHLRRIHLFFAPLKKKRMDFVIEKCSELGVTDFHPIVTERTEVRSLKTERVEAQIIEACEQSERLDIPTLHHITPLATKITQWDETPIYAAIERHDAPPLWDISLPENAAFLIGPVGGFTQAEREMLINAQHIHPVSLGQNILRAETASIICMCAAFFSS